LGDKEAGREKGIGVKEVDDARVKGPSSHRSEGEKREGKSYAHHSKRQEKMGKKKGGGTD